MKVAGMLAALLCVAACQTPAPDAGIGQAERAALDRPAGPGALALELLVPGESTVVPWTFPAPELHWDDRFAANTFRVRLLVGAKTVAEAFTGERTFFFSAAEWARLRDAAGEGGGFAVELVAASTLPDGTVLRGPAKVLHHARFSGAGEHPTGHVTYGWKERPPGSAAAPVHIDQRGVVPMLVGMDGKIETLLSDTGWTITGAGVSSCAPTGKP